MLLAKLPEMLTLGPIPAGTLCELQGGGIVYCLPLPNTCSPVVFPCCLTHL